MNNIVRRSVFSMVAFTALLGLDLMMTEACSDSTSGKHVVLATRITASDLKTPFTNDFGWEITIDKLNVSVGSLYYFDGDSLLSSAEPRGPTPGLGIGIGIGIKSAFAHPGHYMPGSAMGQMLSPATSADLAAGDAMLPNGDGITGSFRSGRFVWGMTLAPHVMVIGGKAKKGADTIPFVAEVDPVDTLDASNGTKIEGCPFVPEPTLVGGDGTIVVKILPKVWMAQADFTGITPPTNNTPVTLAHDSLPFRGIARGVKEAGAIAFSFVPNPAGEKK